MDLPKGGRHRDNTPPSRHPGRRSSSSIDPEEPRTTKYRSPVFPRREDEDYRDPRRERSRSRSTVRDNRDSGVGMSAFSDLSTLELDFIRSVPYLDLPACVKYLAKEPSLVQQQNAVENYLDEAIGAMVAGDHARAKNCAEKCVFIGECQANVQELTPYLRDLMNDREKKRVFDGKLKQMIEVCEARSRTKREEWRVRADSKSGIGSYRGERQRSISDQMATMTITRSGKGTQSDARHREEESRHHSRPEQHVAGQDGYLGSQNYELRHSSGPPLRRQNTQSSDTRHSTHSGQARPQPLAELASTHEPSVVGDVETPFHQQFQVRRDARAFFRVGRVFSMMFYNKDTSRFGFNNDESQRFSTTRQGDRVIGHHTLLIVVKACGNFCWAICINTYGDRGVGKPGFHQADINAHAIAHSSDLFPTPLLGEPLMRKDPIAIDLVGGESLRPESRICFSKPHSIEHNVPVRHIGQVSPGSMPYFLSYCREYLMVDYRGVPAAVQQQPGARPADRQPSGRHTDDQQRQDASEHHRRRQSKSDVPSNRGKKRHK